LIRILVVEDDQEKLRRVTLVLTSATGCSIDQIRDARDATAAKRLLRDEQFDLLVLDISLPLRSDQEPDRQGGLTLLDEVLGRNIYRRPAHIVGLTAYEDTAQLAAGRFRDDAFGLVRYDPSSQDWEETIRRKVEHIVASKFVDQKAEFDVDLCVLTALEDPELTALLDLKWGWQQRRFEGDGTVYQEGTTIGLNGAIRVVAAAAPRMGMVASAVLASKMTMRFRPRYLAMIGIAAGVKDKVEIGDILAADPCWNYESGKRHVNNGAQAFSPEPHQVAPDNIVRGSLSALARDQESLDELRRGWKADRQHRSPALRIGPVASGAAVLQDDMIVATILAQHRKTIGIEMESYSVFVAASEAPAPQPRAFSIKAVCDFADKMKNDNHQAYAAYVSAGALRLLVERHLPF
jgi:nucleoside phosphorylase